MKLQVLGNTSLLQYVELSRDATGVLRLHLEATERGVSITEGSGLDRGRYPGPFLTVMPNECSTTEFRGCEVWIELDTLEEHAELSERVAFITQSKENCYVAFLPIQKEGHCLGTWEAQR
jgi:hypothetical protein